VRFIPGVPSWCFPSVTISVVLFLVGLWVARTLFLWVVSASFFFVVVFFL